MSVDYLVTGAKGQLGRALLAAIAARGQTACATDVPELCVDDLAAVRSWLTEQRPRVVLHGGAVTDVDGCERDPALAERVNATGTANVATVCAELGLALCYVSTDFVFDGAQRTPYQETDRPNPLSVYGRSKWHGEEAVLGHGRPDFYVVRTSWVFGPGGKNFPKAILQRARSGQPLVVVTDQVGRPTMTQDLAAAMLELCAARPAGGIYHCANEGECSWHQFAVDILAAAGLGDVAVGTQTAAELSRPAARPAYSVLDTHKLQAALGRPLPHYTDALRRHLQQEPG